MCVALPSMGCGCNELEQTWFSRTSSDSLCLSVSLVRICNSITIVCGETASQLSRLHTFSSTLVGAPFVFSRPCPCPTRGTYFWRRAFSTPQTCMNHVTPTFRQARLLFCLPNGCCWDAEGRWGGGHSRVLQCKPLSLSMPYFTACSVERSPHPFDLCGRINMKSRYTSPEII